MLAETTLVELDVSGLPWVDDLAEAKLRALPVLRELRCRRAGGAFLRPK